MYSVDPATDSRSTVTRGLGHRLADTTSARANSTPARMARSRGLFADKRASASDSVNINDCASLRGGPASIATATQSTACA
jgi:cytochrome c peroxidase